MDVEKRVKKARSLVLRYLTYRPRSKQEVLDYLTRKGYESEIIQDTISEMERYGYIDDYKFANDFIVNQKMRGHGVRRVRYELQLKNIERQIIDDKIAEMFDPEEDLSRIKELIERRKPAGAAIDQRWLSRQSAFLQRRGFQENLIYKVLKDYNPSE